MKLRTASVAEQDIIDASLWLDQQQLGSGDQFQAAMVETATSITRAPFACPTFTSEGTLFKSTLRWRSVGRFPYVAIFTAENDDVLIIAVLHNRRDIDSILRQRVGIA